MHTLFSAVLLAALPAAPALCADLHVSAQKGLDTGDGSAARPFKTISAAAQLAMPGDTILVHAGVYRERVSPPRGGTSDALRITYAAAPGERAIITGSDAFKTWEKVSGDTWKLTLPNKSFGNFNPYALKVGGDWFNGEGRIHRRGDVFVNGEALPEAANLNALTQGTGAPAWFSTVDGLVDDAGPQYIMNIGSLTVGAGARVSADKAQLDGQKTAPSSEGGLCVGYISPGSHMRFDGVDFGTGAESLTIRASAIPGAGGVIELRDGHFDGPLLGKCEIQPTGDWQKWRNFTASIKKTSGMKNLCLVFKTAAAAKAEAAAADADKKTTVYARFPAGTDPNGGAVEISMRPTVFTPEKTNIDYITLRGFDLRNAATNWSAPTMGQVGLVSAYWCRGWVIENNEIHNSRCSGIALGKYSDQWDGKRGTTEGYYDTIKDAQQKGGWSRDKIGSHIVRNNHIHHCGQNGIVGSLGCAFSRIEDNEIHDINLGTGWSGAEMAGIKFHGAIDVVIANNHIYRCGNTGAIWLDWMAQGTQVTGNLFHDNNGVLADLFTEVDHGPILVANNLFLSPSNFASNSRGLCGVHNLAIGRIQVFHDRRNTPFMKPHSTDTAGLHVCPAGDYRWYNNVFAGGFNLGACNISVPELPSVAAGNVYAKGAVPANFDVDALKAPVFDAGVKLTRKADGWYLSLNEDKAWKSEAKRKLVTTELLGKAKIPNLPYENADGSPLAVDTDYFGKKRDAGNPFPGPFEVPVNGEVKVWPK